MSTLTREAPRAGAIITRELLHQRAIREESRECDFVASTDAVDSYDEIVDQTWHLERFHANPVILFAHNSRALPIGQATHCAVEGGQLVCTIKFASEAANPLAENVWRCVVERCLRAVSVGFMPGSVRLEKRNGKDVYVLSENVLHEVSVVPVPANPDSLARMRALGLEPAPHVARRPERATTEPEAAAEVLDLVTARRRMPRAGEDIVAQAARAMLARSTTPAQPSDASPAAADALDIVRAARRRAPPSGDFDPSVQTIVSAARR